MGELRLPARPALDGPWATLGQAAFDAFVRRTAEAIVAELSLHPHEDGEETRWWVGLKMTRLAGSAAGAGRATGASGVVRG